MKDEKAENAQERSSKNSETSKVKQQEQPEPNYQELVAKMGPPELKKLFARAEQANFYLDSLQRSKADYENYRKRMEREHQTIYRYANQDLLKRLIGVMDFLERAITSVSETTVNKNFFDGICLVQKEFSKTLQDFGVKSIEAAGQRFDPSYHEAMRQQETKEHPDLTVIQEFEKGYMLHDRVLRASKVVVSRNSEQQEAKKEPNTDGKAAEKEQKNDSVPHL